MKAKETTKRECRRRYREKHRDAIKAYETRTRDTRLARKRKHRETNREAINAKRRAARAANPEARKAADRKQTRQAKYLPGNRERLMLRGARNRAKKKGMEFTITIADVVIPAVCPILGISIDLGGTRSAWENSPSLDRIDNTKGYVPGNVWVISYRANTIKSYGTAEEHQRVAHAMLLRGVS